jgi:Fe-S cluster assembly ATP-binding protein
VPQGSFENVRLSKLIHVAAREQGARMLRIQNLHVSIDGIEILRGLNLDVNEGEIHAIMGPNGSGKSTLAKVLAGHPAYTVTQGSVLYDVNFKDRNLLEMDPDERAREGVFLAFQYPIEVPGVNNLTFLRAAFNAVCKQQGAAELSEDQFKKYLSEKIAFLEMDRDFADRGLNAGLSGGEKKKNEIIQMAVLNPRLALLDETDSGLDVDALRMVAEGVNRLRSPDRAMVLVTHYQRLLNHIEPDFVHVLYQGRIVCSGGKDLALKIESEGYDDIIAASPSTSHTTSEVTPQW